MIEPNPPINSPAMSTFSSGKRRANTSMVVAQPATGNNPTSPRPAPDATTRSNPNTQFATQIQTNAMNTGLCNRPAHGDNATAPDGIGETPTFAALSWLQLSGTSKD